MKRKSKPKLEVKCVRTDVTRDHVALYDFTYIDKKTGEVDHEWHPLVNLDDGDVFCDCDDFKFRRRPQARAERIFPNIGTPRFQCKHIQRAVNDCLDRRDITFNPQGASSVTAKELSGRNA